MNIKKATFLKGIAGETAASSIDFCDRIRRTTEETKSYEASQWAHK